MHSESDSRFLSSDFVTFCSRVMMLARYISYTIRPLLVCSTESGQNGNEKLGFLCLHCALYSNTPSSDIDKGSSANCWQFEQKYRNRVLMPLERIHL
jgi:hypothetical protein